MLYTRKLPSPDAPSAVPFAAAPVPAADAPPGATLLEGLGDHHFAISSTVPDVARWFDQGLMLTYGFNHANATAREQAWIDALSSRYAEHPPGDRKALDERSRQRGRTRTSS